jgi:Na+-transporting NADH:ubiquinone oxidoreductase subunit F
MRAYSVSSVPSKRNSIELIIRLVPEGICTTWVFNHLAVGQAVRFSGPYGEFRLSQTDAPCIFIAGGSGMAPIRSILLDMKESGTSRVSSFFFGALTRGDLIYMDEMNALAEELPWFTFIPALSKEPADSAWQGERGLITEVVGRHFPDTSKHEAYLCGSPGMVNGCIQILTKNGMPENKMFFDKFA